MCAIWFPFTYSTKQHAPKTIHSINTTTHTHTHIHTPSTPIPYLGSTVKNNRKSACGFNIRGFPSTSPASFNSNDPEGSSKGLRRSNTAAGHTLAPCSSTQWPCCIAVVRVPSDHSKLGVFSEGEWGGSEGRVGQVGVCGEGLCVESGCWVCMWCVEYNTVSCIQCCVLHIIMHIIIPPHAGCCLCLLLC